MTSEGQRGRGSKAKTGSQTEMIENKYEAD